MLERTFPGLGLVALKGHREKFVVAAPAEGNDWELKLPGGYWWRFLFGVAQLTTSAVAAKREPGLKLLDQDGVLRFSSASSSFITVSKTAKIGYAMDFTTQVATGEERSTVGFPNMVIEPGWTLASDTAAIQAADKYSLIVLTFEALEDTKGGRAAGLPVPATIAASEEALSHAP